MSFVCGICPGFPDKPIILHLLSIWAILLFISKDKLPIILNNLDMKSHFLFLSIFKLLFETVKLLLSLFFSLFCSFNDL